MLENFINRTGHIPVEKYPLVSRPPPYVKNKGPKAIITTFCPFRKQKFSFIFIYKIIR